MNGTRRCEVIDLSQTGARIAASEPPRVGATVVVEDVTPELFGTVRWCVGEQFGLHFETLLAVDDVVRLRQEGDLEPERARQAVLTTARRWVTGAS